jgi:soluble lytic murein transglycosylase-like protein
MRLRAAVVSAVILGTLAMPVPALAGDRAAPLDRGTARLLLIQAAHHHGLRPGFVLAVAYWESGWNQQAVSATGAIGLMQVEPSTGAWAGRTLLHRRVNLYNPRDNAEVGAAILRYYLDRLHDPALALAAYYQGLRATLRHGIYRSSRAYVQGILHLAKQF